MVEPLVDPKHGSGLEYMAPCGSLCLWVYCDTKFW